MARIAKQSPRIDPSLHAAALCAAALIAHQVGGKATRDALFLSHFDVAGLASMVVVASLLSILIGVAGARLMSRVAPGRLVPRAFLASAALLLLEWGISRWSHSVAAVLVYLQIAALGSALISGFWSLLADCFDPHTARKQFSRVVAAGTFGGMVGGLIAERIGTAFGVLTMLPVLAVMDLICAMLTSGLARGLNGRLNGVANGLASGQANENHPPAGTVTRSRNSSFGAFRILRKHAYLRHLAVVVVLSTVGAGLLDYVFKARAVAGHHGGADLVRFFAIFYTAVGVITFLVQIALSRLSLERFGLAGTIGSLPFALAAGSVGGMIVPALGTASLARGSEAVLRSSLFRSGYELFYAAVPSRDRRETKPILDIGFERFGDMLGGVIISILLLIGSASAIPLMLAMAGFTGVAGLWVSRKLHRGYVKALENNLLNQSIHIEISDIRDSTTRAAVMQTMSLQSRTGELRHRTTTPPTEKAPAGPLVKRLDPVVERVSDLRSRDAGKVRAALRAPLDAALSAHAIGLLAWNAVSDDAVKALQHVAPSITGQLVDALLDPKQEFAVRRRIPRVLSVTDSKRAFDGLAQALFDSRFEVRFQAGRALAQIQDRAPGITVDRPLITQAVLQELDVDKEMWENRSVIDGRDQEAASVSSEHVFRLLSLILPRDPLRIAYRGLHSGDDHLKGMAIEYLESVLPDEVRRTIWPLIEGPKAVAR